MAKSLISSSADSGLVPARNGTHITIYRRDNSADQLLVLDDIMDIMLAAFNPAYGEAWNRAQTQSMLSMPSTRLWLAKIHVLLAQQTNGTGDGAHYTGFVIASGHADEQEIMLVAVMPEWQSHNIGRTLLQAVFSDAENNGITKLFLEMRHNNPAASFYKSLGFSMIGRRKSYYAGIDGERYDAITLMRDTA